MMGILRLVREAWTESWEPCWLDLKSDQLAARAVRAVKTATRRQS